MERIKLYVDKLQNIKSILEQNSNEPMEIFMMKLKKQFGIEVIQRQNYTLQVIILRI